MSPSPLAYAFHQGPNTKPRYDGGGRKVPGGGQTYFTELASLQHRTLDPLRTRLPRYDGRDCSSKGARVYPTVSAQSALPTTKKCKHTGLHEHNYQRPRQIKASDPARRAPTTKKGHTVLGSYLQTQTPRCTVHAVAYARNPFGVGRPRRD